MIENWEELFEAKISRATILALLSYIFWGFFPIYWKLLIDISPFEIVSHRMIWTGVFLYFVLKMRKLQVIDTSNINLKALGIVFISALLIGSNWLVYIIAVNSNDILSASLGYFISPLMTLGLGILFYKERLRKTQSLALFLATLGVLLISTQLTQIPYSALYLALSFSLYGFIRKKVSLPPLNATCVESFMMSPFALALLFSLHYHSEPIHYTFLQSVLLIIGGAVTGIPLWLFNEGAKELPMKTIGFYQYISPSLQFLTAIFIFHEEFTLLKFYSFGFIWLGLAIYTYDLLKSKNTFT